MSAYGEFQTTFTDAALLCEALREMGFAEVQNHSGKPQHLKGYRGDTRPETADVIIPRRAVGTSSNDIGFARGKDGKLHAIVSEFDSTRHDAAWLGRLHDVYAEKNIMRYAAKAGKRFAGRREVKNGKTGKTEIKLLFV